MHVHVLGICGTFMGGLAILAKALGHRVSGSDAQVYPPMSEQLRALGIPLREGYAPEHLDPEPDLVVIGNALSRGNPAVEHVLDAGLPYTSGPQWLAEHVLARRPVLAIAGTHGKTTTASMLAYLLERVGLAPGFLIGGVALDLEVSARLGDPRAPFVVEADEYDTAFFDKRSKFVHYRPTTLVLNNLEYDHADIFPDLQAIQRQFHHLIRTVPGRGLILYPSDDAHLAEVLRQGCWTPTERIGPAGDWQAKPLAGDGSRFEVHHAGRHAGRVSWSLVGGHNVRNGLAAIAAAHHAGVAPARACALLGGFRGVRRRLELLGTPAGVRVYDDFAHHPTAIRSTLEGLRRKVGPARIIVVFEPRSNTMRMGVHRDTLGAALSQADQVIAYAPAGLAWDLGEALSGLGEKACVRDSLTSIITQALAAAQPGDHLVVMSNGGFGGVHRRLIEGLRRRDDTPAGAHVDEPG